MVSSDLASAPQAWTIGGIRQDASSASRPNTLPGGSFKCRGGDSFVEPVEDLRKLLPELGEGRAGGQLVGEHLLHSTSMATRSGRSVSAA